MFNVINSYLMNNLTAVQELSMTLQNIQGQQNVLQGSTA